MSAKTKEAVVRTAMLVWKYEPVDSAQVGYTRRYDKLVKACHAHAKTTKPKGKL